MEKNIIIKGIGRYIPEKVVKNDFFIEHFHKEEWGNKDINNLLVKLGRDERRLANRDESSLTMDNGSRVSKKYKDKYIIIISVAVGFSNSAILYKI